MGISVINKLRQYVEHVGYIDVKKTNLPPKHVHIFEKKKE